MSFSISNQPKVPDQPKLDESNANASARTEAAKSTKPPKKGIFERSTGLTLAFLPHKVLVEGVFGGTMDKLDKASNDIKKGKVTVPDGRDVELNMNKAKGFTKIAKYRDACKNALNDIQEKASPLGKDYKAQMKKLSKDVENKLMATKFPNLPESGIIEKRIEIIGNLLKDENISSKDKETLQNMQESLKELRPLRRQEEHLNDVIKDSKISIPKEIVKGAVVGLAAIPVSAMWSIFTGLFVIPGLVELGVKELNPSDVIDRNLGRQTTVEANQPKSLAAQHNISVMSSGAKPGSAEVEQARKKLTAVQFTDNADAKIALEANKDKSFVIFPSMFDKTSLQKGYLEGGEYKWKPISDEEAVALAKDIDKAVSPAKTQTPETITIAPLSQAEIANTKTETSTKVTEKDIKAENRASVGVAAQAVKPTQAQAEERSKSKVQNYEAEFDKIIADLEGIQIGKPETTTKAPLSQAEMDEMIETSPFDDVDTKIETSTKVPGTQSNAAAQVNEAISKLIDAVATSTFKQHTAVRNEQPKPEVFVDRKIADQTAKKLLSNLSNMLMIKGKASRARSNPSNDEIITEGRNNINPPPGAGVEKNNT